MKILNRYTKELIFEDDFKTIRVTVENAIRFGADLRCADLSDTNLYDTNLHGADLRCADLSDTKLYGADLRCADLSDTKLYGADLRCAKLSDTNLYGAYLRCADLSGADLYAAKNIKSFQCGEYNRVSYAVKHENKTMFKIGCFWGDANKAIIRIKEKYGEDSDYEKLIRIYDEMMIKN